MYPVTTATTIAITLIIATTTSSITTTATTTICFNFIRVFDARQRISRQHPDEAGPPSPIRLHGHAPEVRHDVDDGHRK